MDEYIVEQAPGGRYFVSKCGWGRGFDTKEEATDYIDTMLLLDSNIRD